MVYVCLNSSGAGLNRRGYRVKNSLAPIRETLASGLISLSRWRDRPFYDIMCGSGTIVVEAALRAKNMVPGLRRKYGAEGRRAFLRFFRRSGKKRSPSVIKKPDEKSSRRTSTKRPRAHLVFTPPGRAWPILTENIPGRCQALSSPGRRRAPHLQPALRHADGGEGGDGGAVSRRGQTASWSFPASGITSSARRRILKSSSAKRRIKCASCITATCAATYYQYFKEK